MKFLKMPLKLFMSYFRHLKCDFVRLSQRGLANQLNNLREVLLLLKNLLHLRNRVCMRRLLKFLKNPSCRGINLLYIPVKGKSRPLNNVPKSITVDIPTNAVINNTPWS